MWQVALWLPWQVYRLEGMIAHGVGNRTDQTRRGSFADVCALYTRALGTVRELKALYGSEDKPAPPPPVATAGAAAAGSLQHTA